MNRDKLLLTDLNQIVYIIDNSSTIREGKIVSTQYTPSNTYVTIQIFENEGYFFRIDTPSGIFFSREEAENELTKIPLEPGCKGWYVEYYTIGNPKLHEVECLYYDNFTQYVELIRVKDNEKLYLYKNSFYPSKETAVASITLCLREKLNRLEKDKVKYESIIGYVEA